MSWEYDYLYDELREKVKELLKKAGIEKKIDDVDCEIGDVEGHPDCGAYTGKIVMEDGSEHGLVFVVYRKPKLFNPSGEEVYFGTDEEYNIGVHKIILNDGKVIKGDIFNEMKKTFENDFKALKDNADETEKELQKEMVKTCVKRFQFTKKRRTTP